VGDDAQVLGGLLALGIRPRVCSNCTEVACGNYGLWCSEFGMEVSEYDAVECDSYVSVYQRKKV